MKSGTSGVIEGRAGPKLSEDDRLDSLMALACLECPESTKSLWKRGFWQLFRGFWAAPGLLLLIPQRQPHALHACAAGLPAKGMLRLSQNRGLLCSYAFGRSP